MSNSRYKLFFTTLIAACLMVGANSVMAGHHGGHGGWGWHGGGHHHHGGSNFSVFIGSPGLYFGAPYRYSPYPQPYYYPQCGWVRGHYDDDGFWVPPQRVCW